MYQNIRENLSNSGYYKIKSFFPKKKIIKIQEEFFHLSKKLYITHYDRNFEKNLKDGFDVYSKESLKKKNSFNSKFYELCKKLNSFHEIFFEKKTKNLIKNIFKKKNYGILNRGYGFRFDYPNDNKYLTQLHQDYTSNLGSPKGFVLITPLKNISKKMGPIKIYAKSHKNGIQNIRIKKNKKLRKTRVFEVDIKSKNKNILNHPKQIMLNIGDLLIIDFLTLHESTKNISKDIRYTMIYRFIDYEDNISIKNFVPGGEQDNNFFNNFHSDKIVK